MLLGTQAIIDGLMEKYQVGDKDKLIQKLLEQFKEKSIREQLASRKIFGVYPLVMGAKAHLVPVRGGFIIFLQRNCEFQQNCEDEWPESIGHELAHTFFYDLECSLPRRRTGLADSDEERFCEDFAIRWAELNRTEFELLLKKWQRNGWPVVY